MSVDASFCGIELAHPIVNASGTFDAIAARRAFGDEVLDRFPFSAYVSKTITPAPRAGNPPPRLWEEPAGMVNSIGLPNKGLDGFLELGPAAARRAPGAADRLGDGHERRGVRSRWSQRSPSARGRGARAQRLLPERPLRPDRRRAAGGDLGADGALRPLTAKPLIVKLTPNVAEPAAIALAAEQGGADAVSLINTIKAAPTLTDGTPWLGAGSGGLSGPAVRSIALKQVADVVSAVEIPVVGMGGVERGATPRRCWGRARPSSRSAPPAFAIRSRRRGSSPTGGAHGTRSGPCRKTLISAFFISAGWAACLDLELSLSRIRAISPLFPLRAAEPCI